MPLPSWLTAACLLCTALLIGCASPIKAQSDFDPNANFGAYRAYSWISEHPLKLGAPNASPLFESRAMRAISRELDAKGYRFEPDPNNADFVVSFFLGARDKTRVTSYPSAYRGSWGWGAPYHQNVDVRNYTEGTLSIDLFDVRSHQPVWHGWAVKTISGSDQANPTPVINEIIATILAKFPPP
ncbi:MAG: DUF4136 domain-containing protein [Pseudomonadales bacterium]